MAVYKYLFLGILIFMLLAGLAAMAGSIVHA
jgi:hypothetical protein